MPTDYREINDVNADKRGQVLGLDNAYNSGNTDYGHRSDIPDYPMPPYVEFSIQKDYLNARNRFLKGYTSISGEPGYFYFKVLFDFKGSPLLRNNVVDITLSTNLKGNVFSLNVKDPSYDFISAEKFLIYNSRRARCSKRYLALRRFLDLLYYISEETPWAIRSVQGLGEALAVDFNLLASQDKKITLLFSEETTDFRLTLLNDLYRFSCYDVHNQRIIVPENLRKFNMSIIFFSVPIRWFQTPIKPAGVADTVYNSVQQIRNVFGGNSNINNTDDLLKKDNPGYKEINPKVVFTPNNQQSNPNESLSVHMLHFRNCEISLKSTYSAFAQGDNQRPFQTTPKWEIEFQRCYQQDVSEWFDLHLSEFFNHYNQGNTYENTIESMIQTAIENKDKGGDNIIHTLIRNLRGDGNTEESKTQKLQYTLKEAVSEASKNFWEKVKVPFKEAFARNKGGDINTRYKYIATQKLWGGTKDYNAAGVSQILNSAIENVLNPMNNFITLGNIYDDSWASLVSGMMNSNDWYDMLKVGAGYAGSKLNSNFLTNFSNGGLRGISDNLSNAAGLGIVTGKWDKAGQSIGDYYGQDKRAEFRHVPMYERLKKGKHPILDEKYSSRQMYDLTGYWTPDSANNYKDWLKGFTPNPLKNGKEQEKRYGSIPLLAPNSNPYMNRFYPNGNLYNLKGYWTPSNSDNSKNWFQELIPQSHRNNTEDKEVRYGIIPLLSPGSNPYLDEFYRTGNLFDLSNYWTPSAPEEIEKLGAIYMLFSKHNPLIDYSGKNYNIYFSQDQVNYNKFDYYASQDPVLTQRSSKSLTFSMLYGYNQQSSQPKPMIGEQMRTSTPLNGILENPSYQKILKDHTAEKTKVISSISAMYKENKLIPKENGPTQPFNGRVSLIDNMYVNNTILAAQNYESTMTLSERNSSIDNMYNTNKLISEYDLESTLAKHPQPVSGKVLTSNDLGSTESDKTKVDVIAEDSKSPTQDFTEPVKVLGEDYSEATQPLNGRTSTRELLYHLNTLLSENSSESTDLKKELVKLLDKHSSEPTKPVNVRTNNIIDTNYK